MHLGVLIYPLILIGILAVVIAIVRSNSAKKASNEADTPPPLSASPATLYEQLGGTAAVDAAVEIFYRRVLSDAYVAPFFEGVDMDKQAAKQKAFLTMVFGGPNKYTGLDMREGHKHLVDQGLDASHFEHILAHLRTTLAELGVGEDKIAEVIAIADSVRDDVLNR